MSAIAGWTTAPPRPITLGSIVRGARPGTSRVVYARLEGAPHVGSTIEGCDGHGNLNAHIIAGYSDTTGFPHTDTAGYHYGLGMCPFVRVGSSTVFDGGGFTSPDYEDLQSRAYRDGVRISCNSWGSPMNGAYDSDAQRYDALARDAQPSASAVPANGNQEMVLIFATGNKGPSDSTTLSPGTAKNILSIGASENVQAFGGERWRRHRRHRGRQRQRHHLLLEPRAVRRRAHQTGPLRPRHARQRRRGAGGLARPQRHGQPVLRRRRGQRRPLRLPFLAAGQQFFTASSGTSHSAPAVAGACALLRQYFSTTG